ncbi:leucine-rich repeat flightless-interacting protein 1-like isoform X1, partial [Clarias magur]
VTLVDAAKKQKDVEAISVLKAETSHWIESLKRMQSAAELFGNLLYKTQKECEREREVHTLLQAENDEIKKSLIHNVALLKISQVDGKEKDRKAKEAIANLEAEKSELITKIKKKQRTVEKLRSLLYKTKKK